MRKIGDEQEFQHAKRAYRAAKEVGDRKEEARWANIIGNVFKNRGEYVKALEWIRKDYDVSQRFLPDKDLYPTCNALGELYLRLEQYKDALFYQKKHLQLAKEANDVAEQQRASTQLGRTYHEIFMKSEDDHSAVRNAKKYLISAMELAENLKENQQGCKSPFLMEYIDAHNNLGMLEIELDNFEEAEKLLTKGLKICDEEEVRENDDSRSRLHHNLGIVYMEFRNWEQAEGHIRKDISICESIGHCQGEAKGFVNYGELRNKLQRYDEAIRYYKKALQLAKSMEDEDGLVKQIEQNIGIVESSVAVMKELKEGDQGLKKLERNIKISRGTAHERKNLLEQFAYVDELIEKARMIFAWQKHLKYATIKMKIAEELCDKEKLADSYLVIGESNQKLRNFKDALRWYTKSLEIYKLIGNLEGQALSKIEIGNVLDSNGSRKAALKAFKEGYRIASEANISSAQLSALENMHYSYMIRFDEIEKARDLQLSINKLKNSMNEENKKDAAGDCCSETITYIETQSPNRCGSGSTQRSGSNSWRSNPHSCSLDLDEDAPLSSFLRPRKKARERQVLNQVANDSIKQPGSSPGSASVSLGSQAFRHKRNRAVLSDDEVENCTCRTVYSCHEEEAATSTDIKNTNNLRSPREFQDALPVASKCGIDSHPPDIQVESSCSHRWTSTPADQDATDFRSSSTNQFGSPICGPNASENLFHEQQLSNPKSHPCSDGSCQHIIIKIDEDYIHILPDSCMVGDKLNIEQMKVEAACLYYLQLPSKKRETGLVPVIEEIKYDGRTLDTLEEVDLLKNHVVGKCRMEGSVGVWLPKRVMKLYVDCCEGLSGQPNLKLLKSLYNLEVSEDEVVASDCELQDVSVAPLLNALHAHKTVALIDLSHNFLGNETMKTLKEVFLSSSQKFGALVLDLHCNRLGPTALFQICECPVLYSRLEVLNVSGNRLTDSCASYLAEILKNCPTLYHLDIENCSITSRTIQKIADSLDSQSALAHLSIGHNPISSNAIIHLLPKLSTSKRFQELNLTSIKLSKQVVDSLCKLAKSSCLSGLMVGGSSIGTDSALRLTSSLSNETKEVKLDLSSCGLTPDYVQRLNVDVALISGLFELNLGANPIMLEGGNALASLLANPECCVKVLVVRNCQLGKVGILRILEALSLNCCLEELNLAENIHPDESHSLLPMPVKENSNLELSAPDTSTSKEAVGTVDAEYNELVVADSEDDTAEDTAAASGFADNQICSVSQYIPKLVAAVTSATELQLLDLSNNWFCQDDAEKLCAAWFSGSRAASAQSHILDKLLHLAVQGKKCCGVKPCCRRI